MEATPACRLNAVRRALTIEVVHDAWGRLTKADLKVGETTYPRARVEYNGLNMRTLVDRDDDVSDGSHALRERRLLYYSAEAAFGSVHWQSAIALGQVSAVDNAFGFCAYVFNPETGWYTVRFGHYDPMISCRLMQDRLGLLNGVWSSIP